MLVGHFIHTKKEQKIGKSKIEDFIKKTNFNPENEKDCVSFNYIYITIEHVIMYNGT